MTPLTSATIDIHNFKTCIGYLTFEYRSRKSLASFPQNNVSDVQLTSECGGGLICRVFVENAGSLTSSSQLTCFINAHVAAKSGLRTGDKVLVESVKLPLCKQLEIEPVSADDWEIIQLNTDTIEMDFTSQVPVVQKNVLFPFWISNSICVFLKCSQFVSLLWTKRRCDCETNNVTASLDPDSTAAVVSGSAELLVAPVTLGTRNSRSVQSTSNVRRNSSATSSSTNANVASTSAPLVTMPSLNLDVLTLFHNFCARQGSWSDEEFALRVLPDRFIQECDLTAFEKQLLTHPNLAFTTRSHLQTDRSILLGNIQTKRTLSVTAVSESTLTATAETDLKTKTVDVIVEVPFILVVIQRRNNRFVGLRKLLERFPHHVVPSTRLRHQMQDLCWIRVRQQSLSEYLDGDSTIHLSCEHIGGAEGVVVDKFRSWLVTCATDDLPVVIPAGGLLASFTSGPDTLAVNIRCKQTNSVSGCCYLIFPSCMPKVAWEPWSTDFLTDANQDQTTLPSVGDVATFSFQKPLIEQAVTTIWDSLNGATAGEANILITGIEQSGKTCFASTICQLSYQTHAVFSLKIDCRALKGKKIETIEKRLQKELENCWKLRPSILFLDSFDHLCSADSALDQISPGANIQSAKTARAVWNVLEEFLLRSSPFSDRGGKGDRLALLATAKSTHTLHPTMAAPRGPRLFAQHIPLPAFTQVDRANALTELCKVRNDDAVNGLHNIDWTEAGRLTDGYVIGDLCRLLDRIALRNNTASDDNSAAVDDVQQMVLACVEELKPLHHRSIVDNRRVLGGKSWSDVGGLRDVKRTLMDMLLLPAKYPILYSKCQIRLVHGALLYGPSGCGKTLIASVAASECRLNFISVKGPELLSKYIGSSEQSVRDTFTRAKSCKPCVIFFDEFDALAPRRGHDSTGVTDRVVNQLLTELDGVESLEGVFVLAATSRPDLLDPALLRPGRIDTALFCGPPNKEDRLEILLTLSRKLQLADDVDLTAVATACDDFSGADLKGVLTTARLNAVHESLASSDTKSTPLTVHMRHISAALDEVTLSVKKHSAKLPSPQGRTMVQPDQRVTLA